MTERQKQDREALMELYVEQCFINPNEEIEHPPVAISLGEQKWQNQKKVPKK